MFLKISCKVFMQLGRCLMDLIPEGSKINEMDDKLIVDGANGVGGEKLAGLKKMFNSLVIDVRNSGKEGGVLNEGVGADYVQKEKVVPCGFGPSDVGLRFAISFHSFCILNLGFKLQTVPPSSLKIAD